jgi:hypothetical protein
MRGATAMRKLLMIISTFIFAGCASSTKMPGIVAEKCGATSPVMMSDMESFGFLPVKDKVIVMRVFATWCPYCKDDFTRIGQKFKSGEWNSQNVQLYLMTYKNRRENHKSYLEFIRNTFPKFDIPIDAAQIVYVNKDFTQLVKTKNIAGKLIFEGWQGLPFALVFGKDGRLVFRGHFTQGPPTQDAHYAMISRLTKETCEASRR